MCLLGCGVSTEWGAVWNTVKMEPESSMAVFGLGALGLSVIQASKVAGARRIVGVDLNEDKFDLAKSLGATDCVNGGGDVKVKYFFEVLITLPLVIKDPHEIRLKNM